MGGGPIIIIDPQKLNRRKLARAWDVCLILAGLLVTYLATDAEAKEYLASLGGPVTLGIGVLNILLNRLPPLLRALPPVDP